MSVDLGVRLSFTTPGRTVDSIRASFYSSILLNFKSVLPEFLE